jgi:probable F420-dependent oxidoreductase
VKVDYFFPPQAGASAAASAVRARGLGFDGFFTAEASHDPFLPIASAATEVGDLDYGTAIAVAFARSPMVTAMTAWDLARQTDGRFHLGLGTQIKTHITRRFSMEWSSPGPRLREYVESVRAIWRAWQHQERLRFRGDFYSFTLMTPFFDPGPIPHDPPPVYIAAVGPYLCRVAGEVCDGLHVHPFHTVRYIDEVIRPAVAKGAERRERNPSDIALATSVIVVTGRTESEMAASRLEAAQQIAFYASTPAYARVLELHGWDFGPQLTNLSLRGEWDAMAELITDDVLETVGVVAPMDELGAAIRTRYGDRLARVGYYGLNEHLHLPDDALAELVAATAD